MSLEIKFNKSGPIVYYRYTQLISKHSRSSKEKLRKALKNPGSGAKWYVGKHLCVNYLMRLKNVYL